MENPADLIREAERQFTICNACRYCEGYCAVFTAMERRVVFSDGDVNYLANLCHDCRACYQACMYTEPHEFAINIPVLMAQARTASFERYARPAWLVKAFRHGPIVLLAVTLVSLVAMIIVYEAIASLGALVDVYRGPGAFYDVVSHTTMLVPALLLSVFGLGVAVLGFVAFWRDSNCGFRTLLNPRIWWTATCEAGALRWLGGGGGDCFYPEEERSSPIRSRLHHLVAYGFLFAFAATVIAFLMETLFHRLPPYGVLSLPVILGTVGGIAMVVGSTGLLALKTRNSQDLTTDQAMSMDIAFLLSLVTVSATGLLLLFLRTSSAMGVLMIVHFATVVALYLTAPYGKFMHAVYRFGAILRSANERQLERADAAD
jgi:citrate/tricarballylate utilization protein